jgi:hypothetical protein
VTTPLSSTSREHQRSRLDRQRAREAMLRRRRRAVVLCLLAVATLLVGVDLARGVQRAGRPLADATSASPSPTSAGPVADSEQSPSASTATPPVAVPAKGAGTFAVAPGGTGQVGRGTLLRYEVRVENGIGQVPAAFAAEVDATLGDPRSWTAGGRWAFRRVSGGDSDLVITLASPETVDRLCYPLDTGGYTSCRVGNMVVVNLARWLLAVPEFRTHLATYRLYVINHEVGHRLGMGHMACPGPGRLAPVMQQQTLGLKGCRPNPWPYVDGNLVTGPASAAQ